jgi:peptidoglycan/xylan/chitin deacetylase (PgdA/CDA1 family)
MSAQYLLRFDDLCPTMDQAKWRLWAALLRKYRVKPILAIVPENRDPELEIGPALPGFWEEMREWQEEGAAIGLHGYRHVCQGRGGGLIPFHRQTEFAGASLERQREWIGAGLAILRGYGLEPGIWVAPRHGSDAATMAALREVGSRVVSDGLSAKPFRSHGVAWIPQQLWSPMEKHSGLWTICIHPNTASDSLRQAVEAFLERNLGQVTSVDRVLREWPLRERTMADWWFHTRMLGRLRLARWRRGLGLASSRS